MDDIKLALLGSKEAAKRLMDAGVLLMQGDCLELLKDIPDGSVDMVLTDPPYGTTACKWDSVIPFEPMWEQLNRIIKPNGAILLFGSEPFSSALRMSNIKNFKAEILRETYRRCRQKMMEKDTLEVFKSFVPKKANQSTLRKSLLLYLNTLSAHTQTRAKPSLTSQWAAAPQALPASIQAESSSEWS